MISEIQWEKYLRKYQSLMWDISHHISGDAAISNLEDNYADLCLTALESMEGFEKKTGKKFDEFFEEKLFDQYTKTCLWNLKHRKGAGITKKLPLTNKCIPMENEEGEFLDIEDKDCYSPSSIASSIDYISHLSKDKEIADIVNCVIKDPDVLNSSGKINISELSKKLGKPSHKITRKVNKLSKIMRKER